MTKTIAQIVATSLDDAGQDYLEDIVAHGIHNIANAYNGDSDEEYATYRYEFNRQANVLLDIPASPMELWMIEQDGEPIQGGKFTTEAEALEAADTLTNDGFDSLIVERYTGGKAAAYWTW